MVKDVAPQEINKGANLRELINSHEKLIEAYVETLRYVNTTDFDKEFFESTFLLRSRYHVPYFALIAMQCFIMVICVASLILIHFISGGEEFAQVFMSNKYIALPLITILFIMQYLILFAFVLIVIRPRRIIRLFIGDHVNARIGRIMDRYSALLATGSQDEFEFKQLLLKTERLEAWKKRLAPLKWAAFFATLSLLINIAIINAINNLMKLFYPTLLMPYLILCIVPWLIITFKFKRKLFARLNIYHLESKHFQKMGITRPREGPVDIYLEYLAVIMFTVIAIDYVFIFFPFEGLVDIPDIIIFVALMTTLVAVAVMWRMRMGSNSV